MRNYLSFGGGVNSVALYLLMQKMEVDFEAVFVDHGGDWPETYEYVDYFVNTGRPVTKLKPTVRTRAGLLFDNIVDYHEHLNVLPSKNPKKRYCTARFKSVVLDEYQKPPCIVLIGYAAEESHRAVITSKGDIEYRWPLIEHDIDRAGCIDLIQSKGLKVPTKSGCYFCPYQKPSEYRRLRKKHPDLFCRIEKIEKAQNSRVTKEGKQWQPYYLAGKAPLSVIVNEKQLALPTMESEVDYPPCHCGL